MPPSSLLRAAPRTRRYGVGVERITISLERWVREALDAAVPADGDRSIFVERLIVQALGLTRPRGPRPTTGGPRNGDQDRRDRPG